MATSETVGSTTTYKISGYDRTSGKSAVLVVEAASQAAALQQASSRGMAVAACEAMKAPKVSAPRSQAGKTEAGGGSRLPVVIVGVIAVVATGIAAFLLGRRGGNQPVMIPSPNPASAVAQAAAPPVPAPNPQPKGLQLRGTPEEMKQFGFLTKYDESDLPQQFKGYIALLSAQADRLMDQHAFDESVDGNKTYVMWFTVKETEVVRTSSLDSPYRGVLTGTFRTVTAIRMNDTGVGYMRDEATVSFTAGFDVRTDEMNRVRGWVLSDVVAYRDDGAGGRMNVSPQAQKILAKCADEAIAKIQEFLQRQVQ